MSTSNGSIQSDALLPSDQQAGNAAASAVTPTTGATMTGDERRALLVELERDGFTMLGATGKPAALETMWIRISRSKISLGKSAWQAMGSPKAVLGLQRGHEQVLALIACGADETNALLVEWDATLEQAFIRGATRIGALLGAGSKVALIDVVFERGRLMVDASKLDGAGAKQRAVKPKVKVGAGGKQSAGARGAGKAPGSKP